MTTTLRKALERLSAAALARDSTMGDPCALLAAKAELADANKAACEALAAPQPEPEKRIVWCTETDSACSTCPTLRIPCQAATQAAALNARVTVPREPTQEMIAAGEAVFRSYCFRHVNGAIPTYEAMIAAVPAPAVPLTDEQINDIWNAKDLPEHRSHLSPWGMDRIRAIIAAAQGGGK